MKYTMKATGRAWHGKFIRVTPLRHTWRVQTCNILVPSEKKIKCLLLFSTLHFRYGTQLEIIHTERVFVKFINTPTPLPPSHIGKL